MSIVAVESARAAARVVAVAIGPFVYGRITAYAVLAHRRLRTEPSGNINSEITNMVNAVVVLTTVPAADKGEEIARALVEERLAACVNVLPPMTSVYRWRNAVERESECQVIIKTCRARIPALQARLAALHPYELPEFIVLTVADGSAGYLQWIDESCD
jgi:periplasmic divalent cation tolerance protein